MGFLALKKIFEMTPTESTKLESTLTIGFKKNPEKSKKPRSPVKSYDPPNSLHHFIILRLLLGALNVTPLFSLS